MTDSQRTNKPNVPMANPPEKGPLGTPIPAPVAKPSNRKKQRKGQ